MITGDLAGYLDRLGGMMLSPTSTVRRQGPDDGLRDGVWTTLLYLLGAHTPRLFAAAAKVIALRNLDGLLAGFAEIGIVLLAPLLATVAAEWLLGAGRAFRAGMCLAPLAVVALAYRVAVIAGYGAGVPAWAAGVFGGMWVVGLALWVRKDIAIAAAQGDK